MLPETPGLVFWARYEGHVLRCICVAEVEHAAQPVTRNAISWCI